MLDILYVENIEMSNKSDGSFDESERRKKQAEKKKIQRLSETPEKRQERLKKQKERQTKRRSNETEEEKNERRLKVAKSMQVSRMNENEEERAERLRKVAESAQVSRMNENEEERAERNRKVAKLVQVSRMNENEEKRAERNRKHAENKRDKLKPVEAFWSAFDYKPTSDYRNHQLVAVGFMNIVCSFCGALKYKNETAALCCNKGKVMVHSLQEPPQPLKDLFTRASA